MDERRCSTCKEVKPLSDFYRSSDNKSGYAARCKRCQYEATLRWRAKNPERVRAIDKKYRDGHLEKRRAKSRSYYWSDPEKWRARQNAYTQVLKDAAYSAYGGYVCSCCGETEPMFLCLDHVNGDGNEHRRQIGGAERMYQWLRDNGYPSGLMQVLCFNCNQGKRLNGNVCPHKTRAR